MRSRLWIGLALAAVVVAGAVAIWESDWMLERQAAHASPDEIRAMGNRMPGSAIVQYHFARALTKQGDVSGAIEALGRARAADSSSARVVTQLADLLERQARFAEAGALTEGFARSHSQSGEAHYALGVYLYRVFSRPQASVELQEAVRLSPKDARAWRALGEADMGLGRYADAAHAYSKALEVEPSDSETLVRRGTALREAQDLDRAESDMRAAARAAPRLAVARYSLGEMLAHYRNTQPAQREGEDILRSLISENAMVEESRRDLGRLYSKQGRWSEAETELLAYTTARPDDPEGLYLYATALRHVGKPDAPAMQRYRAVKALEEQRRNLLLKVQSEPSNLQARLNLAQLLANHGELAFAISCYERALRLDPGNATARRALPALQARLAELQGGDRGLH